MTKRNKRTNRSSNAALSTTDHPWRMSVAEPFLYPGCHIPDDQTAWSGVVRSYERVLFQPTNTDTVSNLHCGGIILSPYPFNYYTTLQERVANSGLVSDISSSGNSAYPQHSVPNLSGFGDFSNGKSALCRLTSMGVSVTYRGTELNRAGQITFGLLPCSHPAFSNGSRASLLSALYGDISATTGQIASAMVNTFETRIADAPMKYSWLPSVVPTYQLVSSEGNLLPVSAGGTLVEPSRYHAPVGAGGLQNNQYAMIILIEGDYTGEAMLSGNDYLFEIVSHWEVIPEQQNTVCYELTAAPAMPLALSATMNSFARNPGYVSYPGNAQGARTFFVRDSVNVPFNRFSEYFAPAMAAGKKYTRDSANAAAAAATNAVVRQLANMMSSRGLNPGRPTQRLLRN